MNSINNIAKTKHSSEAASMVMNNTLQKEFLMNLTTLSMIVVALTFISMAFASQLNKMEGYSASIDKKAAFQYWWTPPVNLTLEIESSLKPYWWKSGNIETLGSNSQAEIPYWWNAPKDKEIKTPVPYWWTTSYKSAVNHPLSTHPEKAINYWWSSTPKSLGTSYWWAQHPIGKNNEITAKRPLYGWTNTPGKPDSSKNYWWAQAHSKKRT